MSPGGWTCCWTGSPAPTRPAPLGQYNAKRNFSVTAEPVGVLHKRGKAELQFVIQKHWASRLHYDFRLELDGVMVSWAVPKGPSFDPAVKQMASHFHRASRQGAHQVHLSPQLNALAGLGNGVERPDRATASKAACAFDPDQRAVFKRSGAVGMPRSFD